jgi:hypothetical protein
MAFDFPASPTNGQAFLPVAGGPAYAWDGTAWRMTSGGISAGVFIGDAPPANPVPGQLWWDSDSGDTFIYFSDGTSSQWVQFNASPVPVNREGKLTLFISSGTFTPDPDMVWCEVTGWGGGGGGGGHPTTLAAQGAASAGGNSGGKAYVKLSKAQVGASQAVAIGAGGVGVTGANGAAGGDTSFGAFLNACGGGGGPVSGASGGQVYFSAITSATLSATGDIRGWSCAATRGSGGQGSNGQFGGTGGMTEWGGAGNGAVAVGSGGGAGGGGQVNTGSGGGGAAVGVSNAATRPGGPGGSGILIVKEYF